MFVVKVFLIRNGIKNACKNPILAHVKKLLYANTYLLQFG